MFDMVLNMSLYMICHNDCFFKKVIQAILKDNEKNMTKYSRQEITLHFLEGTVLFNDWIFT